MGRGKRFFYKTYYIILFSSEAEIWPKKLKKTEKIESNFYWIDERCVLPKSKESNFKTANNYLFNKINIDKKNIYRIKGENNPNDEQNRYTEILKNNLESINKLPSYPYLELVMMATQHQYFHTR